MTDSQTRLGELLIDGERRGLRFERRFDQPPAKVWRALTESEQLRHWFPADIVGERRSGAEIQLPFWPYKVEKYDIEEPVLPGKILTWDPPHVFEWMWDGDQLHWQLEPDGDGTRLIFTTWIGEPDPDLAIKTTAGYHVCLDLLAELLDSGTVADSGDERVGRLEDTYRSLEPVAVES